MEQSKEKSIFEIALEKVQGAGLTDFISVIERQQFSRELYEHAFLPISVRTTTIISGDSQKTEDVYQLFRTNQRTQKKPSTEENEQEQPQAKNQGLKVKFNLSLGIGDRFPSFTTLRKIGSPNPAYLKHTLGNVMVVALSNSNPSRIGWHLSNIQTLAEQNCAVWKDKVQFIKVSNDTTSQEENNHLSQWTAFEFLYEDENRNMLTDMFANFNTCLLEFLVLVIDTEGILRDIIKHDELLMPKLEEKINRLLANETIQPSSRALDQLKLEQPILTEDYWERVQAAMTGIPVQEPTLNHYFSVSASKFTTFSQGRLTTTYSPSIIKSSTYNLKQFTVAQDLANKVTSNLKAGEFDLNMYSFDPSIQLPISFQRLKEATTSLGMKEKPVIQIEKTFEAGRNDWVQSLKFTIEDLAYTGPESIKAFKNVFSKLNYYVGDSICATGFQYIQKFLLKTLGQRFVGIQHLQNNKTGNLESIESQEGVLQFVLRLCDQSPRYVYKFVKRTQQLANAEPNRVKLHLVFEQKPSTSMSYPESPGVRTYRKVVNFLHEDLETYLPTEHTLLVVNRNGVISYANDIRFYSKFSYVVENSNDIVTAFTETVSQQFGKVLDEVSSPTCKATKGLRQSLKIFPYEEELTVCYREVYLDAAKTLRTTYRPKVFIKYGQSERARVQPLIDMIGKESIVVEEQVEFINLPLGTHCVNCKMELRLPQYYYFTSKVHRCCDCAEKEDAAEEKLRRYPILENSVLIISVFGEREVYRERLGLNIQPQTEDQCRKNTFICHRCMQENQNSCRYVCLICKQQAKKERKYVDFCLECTKIERGVSARQNQADQVRGHRNTHPLLRILYQPIHYHNF